MIRAAFNLTEMPFSKEIKTQQLFMHQFQSLHQEWRCSVKTGYRSLQVMSVAENLLPYVLYWNHWATNSRVVYLYRGMITLEHFIPRSPLNSIIPKFRKPDVANQVLNAIRTYTQQKIQTVLVIDEAHLLS